MKKVSEVTKYIKAQVGQAYWYGCYGQIASAALLQEKKAQYPDRYVRANFNQGWDHQYGQRVHDCVGLIKGALWSASAKAKPKYVASQDVSADGMLSKCTEKGPISTMPDEEGILVFYPGHVGYYIGAGEVVEARGHNYGVVVTKLASRGWKNWGRCPWIDYSEVKQTATAPAKQAFNTPAKTTTTANAVTYFPKYVGTSVSIVDALKAVKSESSFEFRKKIAIANGVKGYIGLGSQNTQLLNLLRIGKLIKPQL